MAASVSTKRAALADIARSRSGGTSGRQLVRNVAIGIVVLGLLGLFLMWLLGFFSAPPEVRAVQAVVDEQIRVLERVARNEAPFEEAGLGTVFESMRQVPREYRDQAGQEIGRLFEAREKAEVNSYFSMPPEQRRAEMDRRLKAEDDRRRTWEAERAQRAARADDRGRQRGDTGRDESGPRFGGGPPGGFAGGPGGANGGGRGPGGPPAGGWGARTEESRNLRSKQRIDSSSAESRARSLEYRRLKEQRRVELGLPARGRR